MVGPIFQIQELGLCWPFDVKNNWYLNSVTWYANPVQISSQSDENWGLTKLHLSCSPLDDVDLLAYADLKNNWWFYSVSWNENPDQISVNRICIYNFRNLAYVDFLVYVDLLAYSDLKNMRWLNSVTWYGNGLQISSQSDENWQF